MIIRYFFLRQILIYNFKNFLVLRKVVFIKIKNYNTYSKTTFIIKSGSLYDKKL